MSDNTPQAALRKASDFGITVERRGDWVNESIIIHIPSREAWEAWLNTVPAEWREIMRMMPVEEARP